MFSILKTHTIITLLVNHSSFHNETLTTCNYNQTYKNVTELQDGYFQVIRFFVYSRLSGSVPRSGNKQSGLFCPARRVTGKGYNTTSGSNSR
ncbi:hypothetical protein A676_04036 [Salmonella enterica subsp. enterica serovar Enteritidis str. 2010K-0262]|nr:hypothetical protein A676_04036 [Salmonella enterica subsp. enterica serovar Enteritidis str. 2010K-0262]